MHKVTAPAAPSYLSADLRSRFDEMAPKLSARGVLMSSDVDLFAKYLIAEGEYLRITNKVTAAINHGDAAEASTWINTQEKLLKQVILAGEHFGLTPASRRRLGLPAD